VPGKLAVDLRLAKASDCGEQPREYPPLAMSAVPAADVAQVALLTTRGRWPRPPFKRPRDTITLVPIADAADIVG